MARSDCGDRQAEYTETATAGSAWTVPSAATVQHVRGPDLGGGTKGLLYSLRNGLPRFNRYNGRGDVVAQSDIERTTTWAASYQADGRRTSEAGTNVERHRACTKEEDPTGLLNEGFRYRDMETGTFISRDPLGLVDGPNVYCYVRQNPWTMWDPEGLETVAQHTANAEWAAKNGKYLDMLACTFMGFGRAINPADAKSELRNASAQMPALVDNARKEIKNSSIPAPLKIVAKAALATAGNAEPLQLLEGGVQVKNTVHTHGLGAVGVMLDGIKKAASEAPVYFISQLTSGFLMGCGGKMLSKPGSGVLAAKTLPPLRQQYVDDVAALSDFALASRAAGADAAATARLLHAERNALKLQYRELTPPDLLNTIEARNLEKFGNTLGPTIEQLRAKGKSWEDIIKSATRSGGADLGF